MGRYAHLGLLSRFTRRDREVVDAAMATMGVTSFADKPLQSLSGGQCQRVHLAQAIAHEADVWFLDEPTAGLDAEGRDTVAACVAAARASGACVVVSTHDIDDAREADIVLLVAKEVIAQGSPREVLTDANLRRMYGFTGQH
jgi:ABC-type Mn2+/Zn2+ transport system ATPase subunit